MGVCLKNDSGEGAAHATQTDFLRSDLPGGQDGGYSTTGYIRFVGGPQFLKSLNYSRVALSTVKPKYLGGSKAGNYTCVNGI